MDGMAMRAMDRWIDGSMAMGGRMVQGVGWRQLVGGSSVRPAVMPSIGLRRMSAISASLALSYNDQPQ